MKFKDIRNILTREDIIRALQEMDSSGIDGYIKSNTYDLVYDGKKYPPLEVIRIAVLVRTGEKIDEANFYGGRAVNSFLSKLGFNVHYKDGRLWQ